MSARAAAALLLVATLAIGCGDGDPGPSDTGSAGISQAEADEAVEALCEVAAASSLDEARAAFFDRAHEHLHHVADVVTETDPSVAAALLEAKFEVESPLEAGELPRGLPERVPGLVAAFGDALEVLGLEPRGCPP